MPPDVDAQIESAAAEAGMSYSAWLASVARKEFTIQAGLAEVAQFETEHGAFGEVELAEADEWAQETVERSRQSGARHRRSA
jgi:hypothetical protein